MPAARSLFGVLLVMVMLILFSSGRLALEVPRPQRSCDRADILFSYLDVDSLNTTYPNVDHYGILNPLLEVMQKNGAVDSYVETIDNLIMYWSEVCSARTRGPEEEDLAWRNLVAEIKHMMHIEQSVFDISRALFRDRVGAWVTNPPDELLEFQPFGDVCFDRLLNIFVQHCGKFSVYNGGLRVMFSALCVLGFRVDLYVDAVSQTCRDYVYVPNPPY